MHFREFVPCTITLFPILYFFASCISGPTITCVIVLKTPAVFIFMTKHTVTLTLAKPLPRLTSSTSRENPDRMPYLSNFTGPVKPRS